MKLRPQETRRNSLLWLLVFVPAALAAEERNHEAHTTLHSLDSRDLAAGCSAESRDGISRGKDAGVPVELLRFSSIGSS
jgi:hypothetical protein